MSRGYDDAEHLHWETRRLLSERLRADWAAVNLYAAAYRERTFSASSRTLFEQMLGEVQERLSPEARHIFLLGFLHGIASLDRALGVAVSDTLLPRLFDVLYGRLKLDCISVLDALVCSPETKDLIRASIASRQMEELINAVKRKHGLG